MAYHYSYQKGEEHIAKAVGVNLPYSHKVSIEISNHIRGMNLQKAKKVLEDVIAMKKAVPYKRFTNGPGHKKGMASGRYPIKASTGFLKLLNSVEANAQFKGLNTSSLSIVHLSAQKGTDSWHYGRHRRRKMKRVHIEVVVQEKAEEKKKPRVKKDAPAKKESTSENDKQ